MALSYGIIKCKFIYEARIIFSFEGIDNLRFIPLSFKKFYFKKINLIIDFMIIKKCDTFPDLLNVYLDILNNES